MRFLVNFKAILYIIILFSAIFLMSQNTFATTANVSSANVNFWSSSSQTGQVQATVSLPWTTNIGGSANDRQSFYLNGISMIYPISALASDLNVYGRLVMRFVPAFTSGEDAYFCDIHLNEIHSSITAVQTSCNATVIYNYADNTTYSVTLPIFFNYSLPSGNLAAYVDYNQSLPNTALSSITANFLKTGNYDIYSVTNGYSLVLTTLVSDASYYITDSGGNVDLSPLVNQNQTIINQNQQIIDGQNQNTQDIIDNQNQNAQDIIRSNQHCYQSQNLFTGWIIGKKLNANNGSESDDQTAAVSDFIPVESNQNYIFSGLPTDLRSFIAVYNSSKQFLGRNSATAVATKGFKTASSFFTSGTPQGSGDVTYIRITAYPDNFSGSVSNINSLRVQLEKGSTVTSYNPSGEICKNYNEEYYEEQRQADQNISNQSSSDIDGATNQQTTNLIGVLSNFFIQLQSFQATNCNLSLPFPQFIGGTQTVNICQGKDVLGNFITVIGTLAMVTFYIPLAWVLLKMIYNEIRSFTNG